MPVGNVLILVFVCFCLRFFQCEYTMRLKTSSKFVLVIVGLVAREDTVHDGGGQQGFL